MTDREQDVGDASFGAAGISETALDEREYLLTGQWHVEHVLGLLRRVFDASFAPARVLDIGCGRGRFALALAQRAAAVTAVEPRSDWIHEARRHASALGLTNIEWVQAGADLAAIAGPFDLIHAGMTPERANAPLLHDLPRLVPLLAPRGLAAVHLSLQDGAPGGPAAALQGLRRSHVRQCHVELGTSRAQAGAMLYFSAPYWPH